ncbi:hypothetical protein ACOMHN_062262 [Nucella lapillus]
MAALVRTLGRQYLLQNQGFFVQKRVAQASSSAYDEMRKYWDINRKLKRPLSLFLTVYKPHLAMMTSLTHRVTEVAMMCAATTVSITLLALPGDFPHYLELAKNLALGPVIIYSAKLLLAFDICHHLQRQAPPCLPRHLHFLNGIRHLAWDAGKGFGLETLYKSAYFAMGLTALVTGYFVFVL